MTKKDNITPQIKFYQSSEKTNTKVSINLTPKFDNNLQKMKYQLVSNSFCIWKKKMEKHEENAPSITLLKN